ncbi:hypothetical protein NADFUDRAFT_52044 [Nadsonia fulvescens var. elongata DSM 6958]|uniref:Uncharacterized protein n=1 Tax=Nadsonia fulvescens var. elongata DSM 6958 TaxID=857566 RepID=A0A1E3PJ51_9ASCO|nr:hypothetical protein NADFUDRAFT_52044 [Nadsonia fulvescens var. elongata DSM 6958]
MKDSRKLIANGASSKTNPGSIHNSKRPTYSTPSEEFQIRSSESDDIFDSDSNSDSDPVGLENANQKYCGTLKRGPNEEHQLKHEKELAKCRDEIADKKKLRDKLKVEMYMLQAAAVGVDEKNKDSLTKKQIEAKRKKQEYLRAKAVVAQLQANLNLVSEKFDLQHQNCFSGDRSSTPSQKSRRKYEVNTVTQPSLRPSVSCQVARTPSPEPIQKSVPRSPARVKLGLDRGVRAQDVSLRRPSNKIAAATVSKSEVGFFANNFVQKFHSSKQDLREQELRQMELKRARINSFEKPYVRPKPEEEKSKKITMDPNDSALEQRLHQAKYQRPSENEILETNSSLFLSKRYMSEDDLKFDLENKHILTVKSLFQEVCPPSFSPPEFPNWVLIAIVAKKGDVRQHHYDTSKKYINITLCDLIYDILFIIEGPAFDKYWKLRQGDVIAILNPTIIVMQNKETNGKYFGLKVSDDYDRISELGSARDLGQCSAITAKGTQCQTWVHAKKNVYCEYHLESGMKRTARSRTEVNQPNTKLFAPRTNGQTLQLYKGGSQAVQSRTGLLPDPHTLSSVDQYGRGTGRIFVSTIGGQGSLKPSGAFFNDDFDIEIPGAKEKRLQNRKEKIQRERELRLKLAQRRDGFLLNDFDQKGQLIADEKMTKHLLKKYKMEEVDEDNGHFTPEQIRKIGFDPTKRGITIAKDFSTLLTKSNGSSNKKDNSFKASKQTEPISGPASSDVKLSPGRESKERRKNRFSYKPIEKAELERERSSDSDLDIV